MKFVRENEKNLSLREVKGGGMLRKEQSRTVLLSKKSSIKKTALYRSKGRRHTAEGANSHGIRGCQGQFFILRLPRSSRARAPTDR